MEEGTRRRFSRRGLCFIAQRTAGLHQVPLRTEEARREQTALLRRQTELLRQQAQPSADSAMAFYCADCVNAGCYAAGQLCVVKNPKLCDCTTHHA